MRKHDKKDNTQSYEEFLSSSHYGDDANVENGKRRRALSSLGSVDMRSKSFFERILAIRKERDFIFIAKARQR